MSNDTEPRLYPMPNKTRIANSLCPLVAALLDLLEQAGPAASPFLHDWPRALIARPQADALASGRFRPRRPVALTLRPRHARWSKAVAALAGDLDWRQTYTSADFGERLPAKLRLERMDR